LCKEIFSQCALYKFLILNKYLGREPFNFKNKVIEKFSTKTFCVYWVKATRAEKTNFNGKRKIISAQTLWYVAKLHGAVVSRKQPSIAFGISIDSLTIYSRGFTCKYIAHSLTRKGKWGEKKSVGIRYTHIKRVNDGYN
jgi:hypothetical protein